MIYKGQYKCRLCGEIEENPCTSNESLVLQTMVAVALEVPCNIVQRPTLMAVHNCKNGHYGLSDSLGYKKIDE